MNEEEKQAVERVEDTFYSDLGKGINKFQKITLYEDSIRDVRIILNLIERMKNCINILDDELKERNKTINEKEIIIEKLQKENEELKSENNKLRNIELKSKGGAIKISLDGILFLENKIFALFC